MTYRVYRRFHNQSVDQDTKTITKSPEAAEAAFRNLMRTHEFWATASAAVLSLDNRNLEFRRFDRIIPIDEDLARDLRLGKILPDCPRVLSHVQGGPADPEEYAIIVCYVDWQRHDAPILDDAPIRLFYDR